jgi:soluble lytic murein transglycosylase
MALTCIKTRILAALGLGAALAFSPAIAQVASDTDILAAKEAAQKGQWRALEALRARTVGHPLEAYPAYWLLAGSLDRANPADVQAFFARHPDGPLAESLRREWLRALGASGQWELFRAEYPKAVGDDAEIACYSIHDRIVRKDADAIVEARAIFLAGREAPSACEALFSLLAAEKRVGAPETWQRIRKVLAAGLVRDAKRASAMLPARDAINDKALESVATNPSGYLAKDKTPVGTRAARELAIFAIDRLARQKPEDAAQRLEKLAPALGAEDTAYLWGRIAWQAALNHDARALQWYAAARDATLTDTELTWKARAALRAREWKTVLGAIQALSPEEARESGWRYWRARALRALGEKEASDALLRGLAKETHFYGLLAAEDTGIPVVPEWNGWRPTSADLERIRVVPGVQRALILYRLGLDNEALREWLWAVRGLSDRDLLAAAEVARGAGIPDRAINTADRTLQLHDYAQRYPTPHRDALAAAAKQFDLDEALLYGIIRQESRFMAQARSRVGATGLMQLMPATARWVARQISLPTFTPAMLTQPELNVQMGTYYLRRVLQDLGHTVLATAAYNAGPGRARRWRDDRPLEGAIYAETIPFNETRDYVKKVMTNQWFYAHRLRGQAPTLKQLLGTVPGKIGEPNPSAVAATLP